VTAASARIVVRAVRAHSVCGVE